MVQWLFPLAVVSCLLAIRAQVPVLAAICPGHELTPCSAMGEAGDISLSFLRGNEHLWPPILPVSTDKSSSYQWKSSSSPSV